MAASARLLFHVQHLLGIGHLRRAALVATALADAGFAVTVAQGGMPGGLFGFGAADVVQLPPLKTLDEGFGGLIDAAGRPLDAAGEAGRRDALLALYDRVRPDLVLLESFPFGRRQMRFELLPLLDRIAATAPRPRVAVSIRDILQGRKPERERETVAVVRAHVDRVLVHGDPVLATLADSFGPAAEIADLIRYTGYVAPPAPAARARERVVVSAGGGAVGAALLAAALAARPLTRHRDRPWTVIAGPNLPEAGLASLRAAAPAGVAIERAVPDLPAVLAGAVVSVSQGGYNTLMDIAVSAAPAVIVPFAGKGETEQPARAARLTAMGAVSVVSEAELTPDTLARAINVATGSRWPALRLDGAAASARLLAELVAAP
jgi:predicted glycosyltransferase